jgi:hypothetical protein
MNNRFISLHMIIVVVAISLYRNKYRLQENTIVYTICFGKEWGGIS